MWAPLFPREPFDYGGGLEPSPEYIVALYDTSLFIEVKRATLTAQFMIGKIINKMIKQSISHKQLKTVIKQGYQMIPRL